MAGKRVWLGVLGLVILMSTGCCSFYDRWCGQRHYGPPSYAPSGGCVPCAPVAAPAPCCPIPAVGSSPAPGWTR